MGREEDKAEPQPAVHVCFVAIGAWAAGSRCMGCGRPTVNYWSILCFLRYRAPHIIYSGCYSDLFGVDAFRLELRFLEESKNKLTLPNYIIIQFLSKM